MRALRWHFTVRLVACLLLTWAAADLLVPQVCSTETAAQERGGDPTSQDRDDCFCCCSHTEKVATVTVGVIAGAPVVLDPFVTQSLPVGAPRTVYHPPLAS